MIQRINSETASEAQIPVKENRLEANREELPDLLGSQTLDP